ncbi:MAG: hypothetical protein QG621_322 [Patescibacteria group bacterium]|nr:hypothetical protein [Patescibacteria group bacterium]
MVRFVLVVVCIYIAQFLVRERSKLIGLSVPVVGTMRSWMVWASVALPLVLAACLLVGWNTQWAAIVSALVFLKHLVGTKNYQQVLPLPPSTYILLILMSLSLLITGAGFFAFDIRI